MNPALFLRPAFVALLLVLPAAAPGALPGSPRPAAPAASAPARFAFAGGGFVLDGKPFRIVAGEMHFQRIPREYWAHRLAMAKALGLNAVSTYVFWNALEPAEGRWDFTGRNDVRVFLEEARAAGLWVLFRPGPYACAEWDFGGLPARLLAIPDIKVRCSDPRYLAACRAYVRRLAAEVRDLSIDRGGPVLMVQLENEYGSYGNDSAYLRELRGMWEEAGVPGPFFTADGASPVMLGAGTVPGAAIGLDPGVSDEDFAEAEKLGRDVPVFCSELYPGWLTHWGEPWAGVKPEEVLPDVRRLLERGRSFSLYVVHGGTSFGFWAGANYGDAYQPDVTSYDYDAPIDEAGRATPKYHALRDLIAEFRDPAAGPLPDVPAPKPMISIPPVELREAVSLFDALPAGVRSPQPRPMEALGQSHGLVLYRAALRPKRSGRLTVVEPHDFATVFADGDFLGAIDRRLGQSGLEIPADPPRQSLEILVEAMGRINYGDRMIDRKGITDRVTLDRFTLMDWEIVPLPLDEAYLRGLTFRAARLKERPGTFYRGTFELVATGDTYLDLGGWAKGYVWVNGNNLGRYWEIGPQTRLYCPAPFLKTGRNEVVVLDLLRTSAATIRGVERLSE